LILPCPQGCLRRTVVSVHAAAAPSRRLRPPPMRSPTSQCGAKRSFHWREHSAAPGRGRAKRVRHARGDGDDAPRRPGRQPDGPRARPERSRSDIRRRRRPCAVRRGSGCQRTGEPGEPHVRHGSLRSLAEETGGSTPTPPGDTIRSILQ